jgi:endonuclease/exonuclease/phosphatase family metal-dependent hydrolase
MRNKPISRDHHWLKSVCLPLQVLVASLLGLTVSAQGPPVFPSLQGQGTLEVMTYNMYVGTEYTGIPQASTLDALYQAVTNAIDEVRAGNPPARAHRIARQIAAVKPDLVSLQEVATWSTGTYTGTWTATSTCGNLTLEYDYRQLLLHALTAQGVRYTPVATNTHFTVDAPTSASTCVRNTWSIVVLARADRPHEGFSYSNVQTATFVNVLKIPIPLLGSTYRLPWPRGWISLDVDYRGKEFRFIAPHLDGVLPPPYLGLLNLGQANELLAGPANTSMPVIVAGDMNSDAANASDPTYPTYEAFLNAGFTDAWTAARSLFDSGFSGYTRSYPAPMDVRSDLVLVRGGFRVKAAAVLCGGSDHCGVVARPQHPGK